MTADAVLVALLGLGALLLFAAERYPSEIVALALLAALALFRVLDPKEALSGFSHPAVIQTASFLVLSEALARTGVVSILARKLFQSSSPRRLLASVLFFTAIASPWMSNTALVALFLPILCEVAGERGIARSRLLIPLSYGAILGGTATVIGTSSHIFGASLYETLTNGDKIRLFTPLPFAAIFLFAASAYLLLHGYRHLPDRTPPEEEEVPIDLRDLLTQVRLLPGSPIAGRPASGDYLRRTHDLRILAIQRDRARHFRIPPDMSLAEGDILLIQADPDSIVPVANLLRLEILPDLTLQKEGYAEGGVEYIEAIVGPNSSHVNQPIARLPLVGTAGAAVLAVRRRGRLRKRRVEDILLSFGDSLILQGPRGLRESIERSREFLFRRELEFPVERRNRMLLAVGALAAVLLLGGLERIPMAIAALGGAVFVVVTGCVTPREMQKSLPWNVLLLIAALIPFSIAFTNSGLADQLARGIVATGGQLGPRGALFLLLLSATLLAQMVQPNGVVAVMLPLAVATARLLQVDPLPFALGVLFSAAYAFATPFSYNTNVMVTPAAGYRFGDFLRMGLPLLALFLFLAVAYLPFLFPF